jgi:HEAT repeat protein
MRRWIAVGLLAAAVAAAAVLWQYRSLRERGAEATPAPATAGSPPAWLETLYSRNPREVEQATQEVLRLGPDALPIIQDTLRDPQSEEERLKGALKAAGILGKTAAPAIPEVAAVLGEPGLTAEAAIALSYMGRDAFPPLDEALESDDPIVRREALRSIGKLKERAPLPLAVVLRALVERMKDEDAGVRAVAATYLGIIHEGPDEAVPALTAGLADPDPEVRRASAAALGSFGTAAEKALPALKRAAADRNDDVAREAGQAIVKLQQK